MKNLLKNNLRVFVLLAIVAVLLLSTILYVFLNYGSFSSRADVVSTEWQISPTNSKDAPLKSRRAHVKINAPVKGATWYQVCIKNDKDVKDCTNLSFGWIDGTLNKNPDGSVEGNIWLSYSEKLVDSSNLTLFARTSNDATETKNKTNILKVYSETIKIYYDFSFVNSTYTITADALPNGDFMLHAKADSALGGQAQYYRWDFYNPMVKSDKTTTFSAANSNPSITDKPDVLITNVQPGVTYAMLRTTSAASYDKSAYYDGLQTLDYSNLPKSDKNKIIIAVKAEKSTTDPAITSGFTAKENQYISKYTIPGDKKFSLPKPNITLFSGGVLDLATLGGNGLQKGVNPDNIEVEVPTGMTIATEAGVTTANKVSGAPAGYDRYSIIKTLTSKTGELYYESNNAFVKIYPTFPVDMIGKSGLKIRMRMFSNGQESRGDLWQEQSVSLEGIPDLQLPKRLTTSFTWTNTSNGLLLNTDTSGNIDQFLSLYKKLGFNTVPNYLTNENPATSKLLFAPEDRDTPAWQGLKYGPEFSAFYGDYQGDSIFRKLNFSAIASYFGVTKSTDDLDSKVTKDAFNTAFKTNLTDAEFAVEKPKFMNAINYNIATKSLDMAYDGVLLQRNLEAITKIVDKTKPEILYLDSEDFPAFSTWQNNVSKSANAKTRNPNNENDSALACRIVDEFWLKLYNAVHDGSKETKIGGYSNNARNNLGLQVTPWSIMQKHNFIAQPELYSLSRNLEEYSKVVRAEKLVLPKGYDLMPWLTTGVYSELDSELIFDQIIHTFTNGSTGFSMFNASYIDDMADVLNISKAIKLISPFEDLIMDGDVAHSDISSSSNAVVSAMKQNSNYLIGVTPKDKNKPVSFIIHTGNGQSYKLVDQKTGESTSIDGADIEVEKLLSATTVYSLTPVGVIPPANKLSLSVKNFNYKGSSNKETVTIKNTSTKTVNFKGYKIKNAKKAVIILPNYSLKPGQSVIIHSARKYKWVTKSVKIAGINIKAQQRQEIMSTTGHIYLQQANGLWNDKHDTLKLTKPNDTVVVKKSY